MDEKEQNELAKLAAEHKEAENNLLQARTAQDAVKKDHDEISAKMVNSVTPEERASFEAQLAEHRPKLENANLNVRERKADVDTVERHQAEAHEVEERTHETTTQAENLAEVGTETVSHLAHGEHFDLGGTSKPIGDAVAWVTNVTVPYVQGVGGVGNAIRLEVENAVAKADAFADSVEAKFREVKVPEPVNLSEKAQELVDKLSDKFRSKETNEGEPADSQKLEKENDAHQRNVSQLNDLQGKISKQFEEDDSQKHIDKLIKEAQNVIKEQDKRTLDSSDGNSATDPAAREQQFQNRVENEKDLNAKRYEVVNELLTPMAEGNVLDRHSQVLEKEAENNNELLKMNERRLAGQPDADIKQKEYETKLTNDLSEKEKALDARWQQDVQQELGGLRRDHFPEVRTPTMDGPALAQSGPSQGGPGDGAGGGGSAMAPQQSAPGAGGAGGGAPQQQGPAGPAM